MNLGSYADLSLAEARRQARALRAPVALGYDVAAEKQKRKTEAVQLEFAKKNALSVGQLADDYFAKNILGRWKHPNIVRARIDNDIKPEHAAKLNRQLLRLDIAKTASDVNLPGWRLHLLSSDLSGHYSIVVNGNWRITFKFGGEDVVLVDYLDYH